MARHVEAIFDTSVLVDYLVGREAAQKEFDRYSRRGISFVTWMELQIGARSEAEADVIDLFLREFRVIELSRPVVRRAIEIRRRTHMNLPSAIICATAQLESAHLVSSDKKLKDWGNEELGR